MDHRGKDTAYLSRVAQCIHPSHPSAVRDWGVEWDDASVPQGGQTPGAQLSCVQGTVSWRGRCRDQQGPMGGSSRTHPSLGGHWGAGNGAAQVSSCLPSCPALTHFLPVWGQVPSTAQSSPRCSPTAELHAVGSVPHGDIRFVQQCLCVSQAVGSQCDAHPGALCHSISVPQHPVPMASGTFSKAWGCIWDVEEGWEGGDPDLSHWGAVGSLGLHGTKLMPDARCQQRQHTGL